MRAKRRGKLTKGAPLLNGNASVHTPAVAANCAYGFQELAHPCNR